MVEVIKAETAEQFVDFLRPSRASWWDQSMARHTHYFRGHANKDWPLLPKGLRPLGQLNPLTPLYHAFIERHLEQGLGEFDEGMPSHETKLKCWRFALEEAVIQFGSLGRQVGLETPFVQSSYLTESLTDRHPNEPDINLAGLAQHHGVPTHLLDWSEDPLTAAFFALGDDDQETDLCVWALATSPHRYDLLPGSRQVIVLSQSATAGNPNVRAQHGVFLHYWGYKWEPAFDGEQWVPFEAHTALAASLTQITLPSRERNTLRLLLLAERRSAAHLMPSWDNVAATLLLRWERSSL